MYAGYDILRAMIFLTDLFLDKNTPPPTPQQQQPSRYTDEHKRQMEQQGYDL
jgi:hypothetical protein